MDKKYLLKKIFFFKFIFFISLSSFADDQNLKYLKEGEKLFNRKNYEESKILFEKDIVRNPKSEKSYLYLAKIFKNFEDDKSEEKNLNTVLLLNPKNEDAIYMLMKLKMKQSNFSEVRNLLEQFEQICISLCSKNNEIKTKLENL